MLSPSKVVGGPGEELIKRNPLIFLADPLRFVTFTEIPIVYILVELSVKLRSPSEFDNFPEDPSLGEREVEGGLVARVSEVRKHDFREGT